MRMRAILPILFLLVFAAALTLAPTSGIAKVGLLVGIAPPAPVIETPPPPPPPPGNVWQPGYWAWDGVKYVLGARGVRGGALSRRRVGGGSLGRPRPRLGMGRRPLAVTHDRLPLPSIARNRFFRVIV
jgi:hypothetical protein